MSVGQRIPNLGAKMSEPYIEPPPVIMVVFEHEHQMEGDRRKSVEALSAGEFRKALEEVSKVSPIMRNASPRPTEPVHYILFLDTLINEHGEAMAMISGFSFMLIPVSMSSDIIVRASLYEAVTGSKVGVYEAKTELNVFVWLPLLPVTPITLAAGPKRKDLYDPCFKDVFIEVANTIKDHPLPPPVPASKIEIRREPEHVPREIRVF